MMLIGSVVMTVAVLFFASAEAKVMVIPTITLGLLAIAN
jgi:hypothetical protein